MLRTAIRTMLRLSAHQQVVLISDNNLPVRVSRRFARALVTSALEGETLYRDALQMLGIKSVSTFRELGHKLGVA